MTETIRSISEEEFLTIDKLLLKSKKIPAIKLLINITGNHVGEAKSVIEIRQAYLCKIGLAKMAEEPKGARYCVATDKGKTWLAEHDEEPVELNPKRHFYLYAKDHYERSDDMIADLKQIARAYCGIKVSEDGLIILIGSEAYQYINENNFVEMLREAHPNSMRSSFYFAGKPYAVRILSQLLKLLSFVTVQEKDPNGEYQWIINLGEPDPNILPLRKKNEDK